MNGDEWKKIVENIGSKPYEVHLAIPRFKIEYERELACDLTVLGMQRPFNAVTSDFSLISVEDLYVNSVIHKTFAQMDEFGLEAAAVTAIIMFGSSSPPPEFVTVDFKVNRPFLYFIKEKSTGLIFFAGVMNKIT
jgi:serpin B